VEEGKGRGNWSKEATHTKTPFSHTKYIFLTLGFQPSGAQDVGLEYFACSIRSDTETRNK